MEAGLVIFIICVIVILAAALPLLRDRGLPKEQPPRQETLRDWRKDSR